MTANRAHRPDLVGQCQRDDRMVATQLYSLGDVDRVGIAFGEPEKRLILSPLNWRHR